MSRDQKLSCCQFIWNVSSCFNTILSFTVLASLIQKNDKQFPEDDTPKNNQPENIRESLTCFWNTAQNHQFDADYMFCKHIFRDRDETTQDIKYNLHPNFDEEAGHG